VKGFLSTQGANQTCSNEREYISMNLRPLCQLFITIKFVVLLKMFVKIL